MQRIFVKEFVENGINGIRASPGPQQVKLLLGDVDIHRGVQVSFLMTQQMPTYVLGPLPLPRPALPQLLQALGE